MNKIPKIRFLPIFEEDQFLSAVREYEKIWEKEGENIINSFLKITSLNFLEDKVCVIVLDGVSRSGIIPNDPMRLRYSYDEKTKLATLIHELSHRLLFQIKNRIESNEHKTIFLFLYDVWADLYGVDFANQQLEIEKSRSEEYAICWNWAMNISKEERKKIFSNLNQTI